MTDFSPELRRLIDAGRGGLSPSTGDRERLRHKVLLAVGAAAPIQAAGATAAASSIGNGSVAAGPLAKLILGAVAAVGVVGGGAVGYRAMTHREPASPPVAESATEEAVDVQPAPRPTPAVAVLPVEAPAVEEVEEPPRPRRRRPRPAAPAIVETVPPVEIAAEPQAPARREGEPATDTEEAAAGDPQLAREVALLGQARAASRLCDTRRALELLARYEREHPDGQLGPEAAFLRVVVLCRSGQDGLARIRASAFAEKWPSSPLNERVGRGCTLPEAREVCDENQ